MWSLGPFRPKTPVETSVSAGAFLCVKFSYIVFFAYEKYVLKNVDYYTVGLPVGVCPDRLVDEVDKPAVAHWEGRTLPVHAKAHDWVQQHCPGVIEHIERPGNG